MPCVSFQSAQGSLTLLHETMFHLVRDNFNPLNNFQMSCFLHSGCRLAMCSEFKGIKGPYLRV